MTYEYRKWIYETVQDNKYIQCYATRNGSDISGLLVVQDGHVYILNNLTGNMDIEYNGSRMGYKYVYQIIKSFTSDRYTGMIDNLKLLAYEQ